MSDSTGGLAAIDDVITAPAKLTGVKNTKGNAVPVPPQGSSPSKQKAKLKGNLTALATGDDPVAKRDRHQGKFVTGRSKVVRAPGRKQRERERHLSKLDMSQEPGEHAGTGKVAKSDHEAVGGLVAPSQISKAYERRPAAAAQDARRSRGGIAKAFGESLSTRGVAPSKYVPPKPSTGPDVTKIRGKLAPLKTAAVNAAKIK